MKHENWIRRELIDLYWKAPVIEESSIIDSTGYCADRSNAIEFTLKRILKRFVPPTKTYPGENRRAKAKN